MNNQDSIMTIIESGEIKKQRSIKTVLIVDKNNKPLLDKPSIRPKLLTNNTSPIIQKKNTTPKAQTDVEAKNIAKSINLDEHNDSKRQQLHLSQ